mmetsp:Transcript_6647/g.20195  ORF Transcript_6647/g.20195 Transcript_6647/m.20195 type:complete len:608 (+) Transcript_6647:65-1888(+)
MQGALLLLLAGCVAAQDAAARCAARLPASCETPTNVIALHSSAFNGIEDAVDLLGRGADLAAKLCSRLWLPLPCEVIFDRDAKLWCNETWGDVFEARDESGWRIVETVGQKTMVEALNNSSEMVWNKKKQEGAILKALDRRLESKARFAWHVRVRIDRWLDSTGKRFGDCPGATTTTFAMNPVFDSLARGAVRRLGDNLAVLHVRDAHTSRSDEAFATAVSDALASCFESSPGTRPLVTFSTTPNLVQDLDGNSLFSGHSPLTIYFAGKRLAALASVALSVTRDPTMCRSSVTARGCSTKIEPDVLECRDAVDSSDAVDSIVTYQGENVNVRVSRRVWTSRVVCFVGLLTAPPEVALRNAMRATWAKFPGNWTYAFLLGRGDGVKDREAWDVVSIDFDEAYSGERSSLPLKTKVIYWLGLRVADWIVKTDDDAFVHVPHLLDRVARLAPPFYGGMLVHPVSLTPIRDPGNKWYVSRKQFPNDFFPPYAQGGGYLVSADAARCFLENASTPTVELMPMEDVYSGILANTCGVPPTQLAGTTQCRNPHSSYFGCLRGYVTLYADLRTTLWVRHKLNADQIAHLWDQFTTQDLWQLVPRDDAWQQKNTAF